MLDALPGKISMKDLVTNRIPLRQFSSWVGVRDKFNKLDLQAYRHIRSPSKAQIQEVLMQGTKDTIILVVHNSDGKIYLSGSDGDMTFDEISRLKRDIALDRAIVLLHARLEM